MSVAISTNDTGQTRSAATRRSWLDAAVRVTRHLDRCPASPRCTLKAPRCPEGAAAVRLHAVAWDTYAATLRSQP